MRYGPISVLRYVYPYLHGNHKYRLRLFEWFRLPRCDHDGYELGMLAVSNATPLPPSLLGPLTDRCTGTASVDPNIGCTLQFVVLIVIAILAASRQETPSRLARNLFDTVAKLEPSGPVSLS